LFELHEIQQREGESAWEYRQKFKDVIGRLAHPIHAIEDSHFDRFLGTINED
jgi:hypothetical protein